MTILSPTRIIVNCVKHFKCITQTKKEDPKPANVIKHPPYALRTFFGLKDNDESQQTTAADHSEESDTKKKLIGCGA